MEENLNSNIVDSKSPACLAFILDRFKHHQRDSPKKPLIVALNGVQGVGKTTLVRLLANALRNQEDIKTVVVSIDDFYLTHEDQVALAASHPNNPLIQVRGQPGTHDLKLAQEFFTSICHNQVTKLPQYDKSAFHGQGDRVSQSQWEHIDPVQVVIFEGWCVGFRSLLGSELQARWGAPSRTLWQHDLEHLLFINDRLAQYDSITDHFDAMIHIDAEENHFVYDWRLQQEAAMRSEKGTGMTDEQVISFVDAYYPAYELFSDNLRSGVFDKPNKQQLRLVVGKSREVKQAVVI